MGSDVTECKYTIPDNDWICVHSWMGECLLCPAFASPDVAAARANGVITFCTGRAKDRTRCPAWK